MRKREQRIAVPAFKALAEALAAASPALAQQRPREGDLKVGDPAPAFQGGLGLTSARRARPNKR